MEEVSVLLDELENKFDYTNPTDITISENINFLFRESSILSELIIHGVYWGSSDYDDIWLQAILKLSYPPKTTNVLIPWDDLQYLPAVIVIYAAGLTAMIRKHFSFLQQLLSLQIIDRNDRTVWLTYHANPGKVIDPVKLQRVWHNTQYVPMNEKLFAYFKELFKSFVPSVKEFEDYFDYFEICNMMMYLKHTDNSHFLWGRFAYRRYPHQMYLKLIAQLNAQKENHELIARKLFNNVNEWSTHLSHANLRLKDFRW